MMQLYLYTLGKTLYEGETSGVTLPAEGGEIGILPHHMPLVTSLKKGTLKLKAESGEQAFEIAGGFAYTDGEKLIVLAD